ncbi:MAG: RdgB/HAM1 family non-canonical purine NTP pyrophosphatase [Candidatus Brocadiia bacterium]
MRLVVASKNRHKTEEIAAILDMRSLQCVSIAELADCQDVQETGATFEENALIKGRAAAQICGLPAVSDDSGIEVDFLGGAPGIFSARFAGENAGDEERNRLLLSKLLGVPAKERRARFVCVAALCSPSGTCLSFRGTVEGYISVEPRGASGFGYDPVFFFPPFGRTFGEVPRCRKNLVSHRARAFGLLADFVHSAAGTVFSSNGRPK